MDMIMKKILKGLFLTGLMVSSVSSYAANFQFPGNHQTQFKITKILAYKDQAVIYLDKSHGQCGSSNGKVYLDWTTDPDIRELYSTALFAWSSNKTVGFGASGCSSNNYPIIYRIDME